MNKKRTGISRLNLELLAAVAFCLIVSTAFYTVAQFLSSQALSSYFEKTSYVEMKTSEVAEEFQAYVTRKHLSTKDTKEIADWVAKNKMLTLCLAVGDSIIFDSSLIQIDDQNVLVSDSHDSDAVLPDTASYSLDMLSRWFYPQSVTFSDQTSTGYWQGAYDYLAYINVSKLLLAVSSLLFIVLLTLLIRKKLAYVNRLVHEITILEGGNLEYEISEKGKDELTVLAQGLNSMRRSFIEQIAAEKRAHAANKELVTALSHDLRTPLTTQMGYLEILKERHCTTEAEQDEYIDKCLSNCRQIKQMSDRLFEYFLAYNRDAEADLPEPEEFDEFNGPQILSQLIAEKTVLLEEKGFSFRVSVPEKPFTLHARADYLFRIFDNLFSNIEKYADAGEPVVISITTESSGGCRLDFLNRVRTLPMEIESTRIGLQSVRSLMKRLDGSCEYSKSDGCFCLTLRFPY